MISYDGYPSVIGYKCRGVAINQCWQREVFRDRFPGNDVERFFHELMEVGHQASASFGRRQLAAVSVILFWLIIAPSLPHANAQTIQENHESMSGTLPALFLDWRHIDRGSLSATFDPARVTEAAKTDIVRMKRSGISSSIAQDAA